MKRAVLILAAFAAISLAGPGAAQSNGCYADYKAQRTQGGALELHYGVIQLNGRACRNIGRAEKVVARRIGSDGWQLLRLLSVFDANGLNQRQGNAGRYFLRY